MKEAAGEANMTVVTIVLIAIVLGLGTLIVTNLVGRMDKQNGELTCPAGSVYNAEKGICEPSASE